MNARRLETLLQVGNKPLGKEFMLNERELEDLHDRLPLTLFTLEDEGFSVKVYYRGQFLGYARPSDVIKTFGEYQ